MISRGIGKSAARSVARSMSQFGSSGGGAAPSPLLLDAYTGAAAAYSLRKLSNSYTGSAIRVRRASDSAEQDIGFNGNDLDTTSLTSFCTGTDGFVTTWYDQSGNTRDATQATTTAQPKIFDTSTGIALEASSPAIDFITSDYLSIANRPLTGATAFGCFAVADFKTAQNYEQLFSQSDGTANSGRFEIRRYGTNGVAEYLSSSSVVLQGILNINSTRVLFEFLGSDGSVNAYLNGVADASAIGQTINIGDYPANIGARNNSQYFFGGRVQEVVLYASDQSTNRTGIDSDIATYYGITLP